jgi:hypothetical protein
MTTAYVMAPLNGAPTTVNGKLYSVRPGSITTAASADVAGLVAAGWTSLTARMIGPSGTSEASAGAVRYTIQPDGTFWVAPADVFNLQFAGLVSISPTWTAPAAPTPTTFVLQMQTASATFQVQGGAIYTSGVTGQISGVLPGDLMSLQKAGGFILGVAGPLVSHTYALSV